jgi:hypothetical protein
VTFLIEDGRFMIRLTDVPVIFVEPWKHPGFTMVLGTNGMKRITVVLDAGDSNGQLTVCQRRLRGRV